MSLTLERQPIDLGSLPEQLHRHLAPNAPAPLKMMAAQGMLPISTEHNIALLYQLANFSDLETKKIAIASFDALPDEIIIPVLSKETQEGVLDWIVDRKRGSEKIAEIIVQNRATNDISVARVARSASTSITEVIATNQVRLLQAPVIIEQLYLNPNTRMATADRIIELAQRENVELKGIPGLRDAMRSGKDIFSSQNDDPDFDRFLKNAAAKGDEQDSLLAKSAGMSPSEKARFFDEHIYVDPKGITKDMLKESLKVLQLQDGASFSSIERAHKRFMSMEVPPENLKEMAQAFKILDTYTNSGPIGAQIARMSISQKIRAATTGSRAEINILVKDPNPLVHTAACISPRVKYPDIRAWAKNKAMPDGVVNHIATSKEYTKNKEIKYLLCMNPKTPLPEAIRFLNYLSPNELKKLASDRNIPMQLRRQAKSLTNKRSGKK